MVEVVANSQLQSRYRTLQIIAGGFVMSFLMLSLIAQFLPLLGVELPLIEPPVEVELLRKVLLGGALVGWGAANLVRNAILSAQSDRGMHVGEVLVPAERYARLFRAELMRLLVVDLIATAGFILTLFSGSALDCHMATGFATIILFIGFPRYHEWERWNSRNASFR